MIYALISFKEDGSVKTAFTFDSLTSFRESWSASIAKTAIEGDFVVSDNISLENPKFSMVGLVSRYSLYNDNLELFWDGNSFVSQNENKIDNNHLVARETLRKLFLDKTTFTLLESDIVSIGQDHEKIYQDMLQGEATEYPNCVISSFDIDSSSGAGGAFFLSLNIEQLNIVDLLTTQLTEQEMQPVLKKNLNKSSSDLGSSSTSTTTDENKDKPSPETVASKATDVTEIKESTKVATMPSDERKALSMREAKANAINDAKAISRSPNEMASVVCQNGVCSVEVERSN